MTTPTPEQSQQITDQKELNFRKQEQMFQRQLAAEKARADDLERRFEESRRQTQIAPVEEDDSSEDPYVDHKKLEKKLAKFGQQAKQENQTEIQKAIKQALYEERKQTWIKTNPDFSNVMSLADKLYEADPELAETILEMPDTFERQKLVYKNIKALGLHQPAPKQTSIQDTIDSRRRSPYYQPSGVASSPYSSQSDFSESGQKQAYEKMKELKARIRL